MPRPQADNRPKEVDTSFWLWISTFVLGLLFSIVQIFFAFLMRGGRSWARIVLAVLGGLFQLLLLGEAIVMMFRPAANAWFRPRQPGF